MIGKWINKKIIEYLKDELKEANMLIKREGGAYIVKINGCHIMLRDRDWVRNLLNIDELIRDIRKEVL